MNAYFLLSRQFEKIKIKPVAGQRISLSWTQQSSFWSVFGFIRRTFSLWAELWFCSTNWFCINWIKMWYHSNLYNTNSIWILKWVFTAKYTLEKKYWKNFKPVTGQWISLSWTQQCPFWSMVGFISKTFRLWAELRFSSANWF